MNGVSLGRRRQGEAEGGAAVSRDGELHARQAVCAEDDHVLQEGKPLVLNVSLES